jgi:hypothetical protein
VSLKVLMAFRPDAVVLPVDKILPLRQLPGDIGVTVKYKRILASLREVGLIEPLIVYPQKGVGGFYTLLDGTIRLHAMKALSQKEVLCLVATEDETYTYNQKINQISPIQEHFMILKAIKGGVSEERIAATLGIDVSHVRQKQHLLTGICPEAVAVIRQKRVSAATIRELKRVVPMRQLAMIEVMTAADNFSVSYAKSLYVSTPEEQKIESERPKGGHGLKPEEVSKMNGELRGLDRNYKVIEETHGENVLKLVPVIGYLKKLLLSERIGRLLKERYPEIFAEFERIVTAPALDPL